MSTSTWAARKQGTTLVTADAHGEAWEQDDVELVIAFTDDVRDEELAVTLGRSLYAIWAIQHRIRTEGVDCVRGAYAPRVDPVRPLSTRTYTFIGDDVPADW